MEEVKKENKPADSDFKQQRLKGWSMSPNSPVLSAIYVLVGLTFIGVGAFILVETGKVVEVSKRYDDIDECKADWRTPRTCIIDIDIDEDMDSPIFFYYEIKNMYQNHRKYFKSRDILQLMGEDRSKSDIRSNCEPVVTMDDLGFYTTLDLEDDDPANPCGLLAKSYFNDTYSLLKPDSDDEVYIDQHDIAWDVDKDDKFERSDDWEDEQWIDVENEHFMNWMSVAGLPRFRKLWGKIDKDLDEGTYKLVIVNNYDVSSFDGQKMVVLTTTCLFGGKIQFMGVLYIVVGGLAIVGAIIIIVTHLVKLRKEPRQ